MVQFFMQRFCRHWFRTSIPHANATFLSNTQTPVFLMIHGQVGITQVWGCEEFRVDFCIRSVPSRCRHQRYCCFCGCFHFFDKPAIDIDAISESTCWRQFEMAHGANNFAISDVGLDVFRSWCISSRTRTRLYDIVPTAVVGFTTQFPCIAHTHRWFTAGSSARFVTATIVFEPVGVCGPVGVA